MSNFVTVENLVETLAVRFAYGEAYKDRRISSSEVSRPGLILTGYKEFYPHERIQLIGRTEMSYLHSKTSIERQAIFQEMCGHQTPVIVISRNQRVPKELVAVAEYYRFPILVSSSKTSRVLANITNYLERRLAQRVSRHGVFVEVFGMGVMLTGASGVGKSETALELIQRGHRLVSDDRVELYQLDELTLMGEAPEILQNLIEIRGLGIIDVQTLYGVAAIRRELELELIIHLIRDDGTIEYDRLGSRQEYEEIFDCRIPKIQIPVQTGRSLSTIIESADMNFRAMRLGYDARGDFSRRLEALILANREVDDD